MATIINVGGGTSEWKLVGTATGTTAITLPDKWDEICIVTFQPSGGTNRVFLNYLYKAINIQATDSIYNGSNGMEFGYTLNKSSISLGGSYWGGDNTANVKTEVYYR